MPPRYRIPPERFESDEPFKHFANIAPALDLDSFDLSGGAIGEDFNGDGLLDLMVSTSDTTSIPAMALPSGRSKPGWKGLTGRST